MTKQGVTIHQETSEEDAVAAAAHQLIKSTSASISNGKKVLLLLAGGSATKIYQRAARLLATGQYEAISFTDSLFIAMEDDRWPQLNNTADLKATGFLDSCVQLGANFYELPDGTTREESAGEFEQWLKNVLEQPYLRVIMVVGIGADGHILGVNLDPDELRFNQLFLSSKLATSYQSRSQTAAFPQFPERITVTLSLMKHIDYCLCLVLGEDKKPMLEQLLSHQSTTPNEFPAVALWDLHTHIYTNLELQNPNEQI